MSGRESWNFLNLLPDIIKEKISDMGLSEKEVNEIIKIWNNQISNKNTQIETEIVKNIKDLISQDFCVDRIIMDRVKEAMDHYVKGQWVSSIALCGLICEYLSYIMIEEYIKRNGIDGIIKYNKELSNQYGRLKLLGKLKFITEYQRKSLDQIRDIRNKYVHLERINEIAGRIKEDNFIIITNLIKFLNEKYPRPEVI
ncbi:MAG: hypothetical protein QT11_C0001G0963 [archaeon GW2011_AR20]|nr:MAG: hypothetical protein QT11_C0001G0963 [archaeon GW2011_AR20]MBS3160184.1 hypothetical protein [Candidatus Woesearchaeota archaeon]